MTVSTSIKLDILFSLGLFGLIYWAFAANALVIAFILFFVILIQLGCLFFDNVKKGGIIKRTAVKIAKDKTYDFYDVEGTDTLVIYNRNKHFRMLLPIVEVLTVSTHYVPEEYHVGAVSVGSVTTGGVYKTGGYNKYNTHSSDKYKIGIVDTKLEVRYIKLMNDMLVKSALESRIKDYVNVPQDGSTPYITVRMGTDLTNADLNSLAAGDYRFMANQYTSYDKCKAIVDWLCDEK